MNLVFLYTDVMDVKQVKVNLIQACSAIVDKRYQKIKMTMDTITEALLEESRSTAGDKHETGRAMLEIDRENAGKQLMEVETVALVLRKIDINAVSDYVRLGSLVSTNLGYYFISISVGAIVMNENTYYCVALQSPIGQLLSGKKKGDSFSFNSNEIKIRSID